MALITGEKWWFVFPPQKDPPIKPHKHHSKEVLEAAAGAQSCLQKASEVVALPQGWWHATFDSTAWTIGLGGQAWPDAEIEPNGGILNHLAGIGSIAGVLEFGTGALTAPLRIATMHGHWQLVEELLKRSGDVRATDSGGRTLLHWAAAQGHARVIDVLLKQRCEPEVKDKWKNDPLLIAVASGNFPAVELLLNHSSKMRTHSAQAPLLLVSAKEGHQSVTELLLDHGANLEIGDESGNTPLHFAVAQGHERLANLLLSRRADAKAKSRNGHLPLHWAAYHGNEPLVKLLLNHGDEFQTQDVHKAQQMAAGPRV